MANRIWLTGPWTNRRPVVVYFVRLGRWFLFGSRNARGSVPGAEADHGKPGQFGRRQGRLALSYVFAFALVGIGTGLRLGLDPVLGDHHPFTLYFAAVAVAAWYGGFGPALFATIVSYFAADWFFITPRFEFNLPHTNLDEFMALMAFLFSCLAIAFTSQKMRDALKRARQKQEELEREVMRRKQTGEALGEAQAALRLHANELEQKVRERTLHLEETIHSLEGVCYHLAHDLRAPLRAMHGFTTILEKEYSHCLDADAKNYLHNITDAASRMDLLIHGLLEFGRLGHESFALSRVDSCPVLQRVLGGLQLEIATSKACVERNGPWPAVVANDGLLEIVFTQLVSNALKFVHPGDTPRVRIYAQETEQPDWIRFVVEDSGIGIPEEHLTRSFWIFERLHPGSDYPGVGMGLAIAYKAIEKMRGRIGVESHEGEGSRFWFELPIVATSRFIHREKVELATAA